MASTQRADRFEQLYKALKKHYKSVTPPTDRKVLDHLLYACCLEDATYEAADEAFAKLQQAYFDSNEVRVTTTAELSESMTSLPKAAAAATRIKKSLQSMFEARYSFDIDDLKKANLGKAIDEITGWPGMSKYVIDYLTQHALGGHAIPVSRTILDVCQTLDLITYAEASKGTLPGVERAIAKSKGYEFASMLHQFGIDFAVSYKHPTVVAVFKDMGMTSKPKAAPPPPPAPKPVKQEVAPKVDPKSKGKAVPPPAPAKHDAKAATAAASKGGKAGEKGVTRKVESELEKAAKKTKMVPPAKMAPPAKPAAKPPTKPTTSDAKSTTVAKKDSPPAKPDKAKLAATTAKKSATEPATKSTTKKVEVKKPVDKNPADKKSADKKSTDKKSTDKKATDKKATDKKAAVNQKPKTKSAPAVNKAPAKRLPVKPATNKKTKPK